MRKRGAYQQLPHYSAELPARQEEDLDLLKTAAPTVTKALQNAGLTAVKPDLNAMPVKVDEWLASPASEGWRLLWLTLENGESGVLVPVEGLKVAHCCRKSPAITLAALPGLIAKAPLMNCSHFTATS